MTEHSRQTPFLDRSLALPPARHEIATNDFEALCQGSQAVKDWTRQQDAALWKEPEARGLRDLPMDDDLA
ncbi:hypothetical protein ACH4FX_36500 [Streptomyces sp. NPDC018019]|uniref:hypothetical protein n=1 Tax=Streptomyces sp. NPDC018019 TaxID=3365030 RepID=UPI0037B89481